MPPPSAKKTIISIPGPEDNSVEGRAERFIDKHLGSGRVAAQSALVREMREIRDLAFEIGRITGLTESQGAVIKTTVVGKRAARKKAGRS